MVALTGLLERSDELRLLGAALRGEGDRLLLIEGEAGFGKTELIRAAIADAPSDLDVLVGACEPLDIPAPFAPLFEVIRALPHDLAEQILHGSDGLVVYAGVLEVLRARPTVLVVDDAHWADSATVGLLRYLGRRIADTPSVLIIAFRPDGLAENDDAYDLIAELSSRGSRLPLTALSIDGVRTLAAGSDLDANTVLHRTGGNPFFVVEVIRQPAAAVPTTISDAVAARLRHLPIGTQHLLETLSLCPDGLDVTVAVGLGPDAGRHIDLACDRRLLLLDSDRVRFRHELIRSSIAMSISPLRRRDLHRQLALALEPLAATQRDVSHLAFHFAEAGDGRRAIDYSVRAARDAIATGAHRMAADSLTRALEYRSMMSDTELDAILGMAAVELIHVGRFDEAIRAAEDRLPLATDDAGRAAVLAQQSFCWTRLVGCVRGRDLAERSLALDPTSGGSHAALAERILGNAAMDEGHWPGAVLHGRRSIDLARAAGDVELEAQALNNTGLALTAIGDREGFDLMAEAARLAIEHRLDDTAAMALNNVGYCHLLHLRLDEARRWFERGIEHCVQRQLDSWHMSLLSASALLELNAGNLDEARRYLDARLDTRACRNSVAEARGVHLRLDMRSNVHVADQLTSLLDELDGELLTHWDRADLISQVGEAAWLGALDRRVCQERFERAYATPGFLDDAWAFGQSAFWALRLGHDLPDSPCAGPFGLEVAGRNAEAVAAWDQLGFPYEAALARARLSEPPIDEIVGALTGLGASAALAAVRRDLRERGVEIRIERERDHPSGLTPRQLDVLELLAAGLSNAAIAERLFISQKTAAHHVSAILAATGCSSRGQAVAIARVNEWI